jgi:arginine-tRNA-protein transferase
MDRPSPSEYLDFLSSSWSDTVFFEFTRAGTVVAVAVTDVLPDALSAVYTFYDPELTSEGLGTYAILWQIGEAARRGLRWCYLGYWIDESAKMRYKSDFRPQERFVGGVWRPVAA